MGIPTPASQRHRPTPARRLRALAVLLVAAPALAACGANFDAATNQPYQPAEGVSYRDGSIYALNTLVVTDGEGNGTVVSRLVNQEDDEDSVQSITATTTAGDAITAAPLDTPIPIGAAGTADQAVQVGTDGLLRVSGDNLTAGAIVDLTFTFGNAAPLQVSVPVVSVGTIYTDIPVGPVDTPETPAATEATG